MSVIASIRDRIGVRTPALIMMLLCIAVAAVAHRVRRRDFVASAVTSAPEVMLSATEAATVAEVLVASGQRVSEGQPLLRLASPQLLAQREELDARIRHALRAAEVARLELGHSIQKERRLGLVELSSARRDYERTVAERERRSAEAEAVAGLHQEAERLLGAGLIDPFKAREQAAAFVSSSSLREELDRQASAEDRRLEALVRTLREPSAEGDLSRATAELYTAELEVLAAQKRGLEARIAALDLRAPAPGVVTDVVARGSSVLAGGALARLAAAAAQDVIAYVAPTETPLVTSEAIAFAVTLADGRRCHGRGVPSTTGSAVAKPPQLGGGFMQLEAWGFPVRFALPEGCSLPIGQVVELWYEVP